MERIAQAKALRQESQCAGEWRAKGVRCEPREAVGVVGHPSELRKVISFYGGEE